MLSHQPNSADRQKFCLGPPFLVPLAFCLHLPTTSSGERTSPGTIAQVCMAYVPPHHRRREASQQSASPSSTQKGDELHASGIVIFRRRETERQAEFLLVQSSTGGMGWTPPKGHLHDGEGELDGARRETQEETSLEELTGYTFFNNSTQPIFRTSYWDGKHKRNKTSVYFLAEFVEGAQVNIQAAELRNYVWLSATPAKQRMRYPEMSQLIDAAVAAMA